MSSVLYIPGFRENPTHKKEPWEQIKDTCVWNWIWFSRFELPWEWKWLFSMTETRKKVASALLRLQEDATIVTYSLSSIPVAEAISSCSAEVAARIWKLIFLHPVQDPVYSVSIMDAILSESSTILWPEHYIQWDKNSIFNTLIWDWKWNADTFQQDLLYYTRVLAMRRNYFQHLLTRISNRGFWTCVEITTGADDRVVTRGDIDLRHRRNFALLKIWHTPKLSPEILKSIIT